MAKQGKKKTYKKPPLRSRPGSSDPSFLNKESQFEESQHAFNDREVEHHIIAIQAIMNAEIGNVLSRCQLVRSRLTNEQLLTPAIQFFKENCPNLAIENNRKYPFIELRWKNGTDLPVKAGGGEMLASVGRLPMPSNSDLNFSARSVKTNMMNAAGMHIPDFALAEPPETQYLGKNSFQVPGVTGQRLSFGMTPKSQRQPKHGEMLLSAHGSPLGVYNDKNLEAIKESDDGSHDSIS